MQNSSHFAPVLTATVTPRRSSGRSCSAAERIALRMHGRKPRCKRKTTISLAVSSRGCARAEQAALTLYFDFDLVLPLKGEQLKRALIEREQDEILNDLGESVMRLGQMGLNIHHELKEQEAILDELDNRTDYALNNMDDVNRLVKVWGLGLSA